MTSNAPFVDQKIYPLVLGVSNSPFTDQRAVQGGGSGGGNVQYDGTELSVVNGAPIESIEQPGNMAISCQGDLTLGTPSLQISMDESIRNMRIETSTLTIDSLDILSTATNILLQGDKFSFTGNGAVNPVFRFGNPSGLNPNNFWKFIGIPSTANETLSWNGVGNGSDIAPFELTWITATATDLNALDITFDTETSVLVLSDPHLSDTFISGTTVVPGRTVLIEDVYTNASAFIVESVIGLSNTLFPPPASSKLIGNNPVAVYFPNQITGLTSWFIGGSFRATLAGRINKLSLLSSLTCTIWSNRGQATQLKLNEFSLLLESVSDSSGLGWSWDVMFTCRSINRQISRLGSVASSSSFSYSDDRIVPGVAKPEGFIVSNVITNGFNTSINQYLDFTFSFNNPTDGLTTNLFIIERIF